MSSVASDDGGTDDVGDSIDLPLLQSLPQILRDLPMAVMPTMTRDGGDLFNLLFFSHLPSCLFLETGVS